VPITQPTAGERKAEKLEDEIREDFRIALRRLDEAFLQMAKDNIDQHGDLAARLEKYHGDTKASLAELNAKIDSAIQKVKDADKKIENRNTAIKYLGVAVFGLVCLILGVKASALGWIKDIGL